MKKYKKILINIILTYLYAIIFLGCLWVGVFAGGYIKSLICNHIDTNLCLSSYHWFTISEILLFIVPCALVFFSIFYKIIQYITKKIEKK